MNFCCDRFKGYYENNTVIIDNIQKNDIIHLTYPKIKIIKMTPDKYNKGKNLFKYLIVCGFEKDNPPFLNIAYCPFCGSNLEKHYSKECFINGEASQYF